MIAIINYGSGNIRSVANALQRLGCVVQVTSDVEIIQSASKIIFPGVGEASSAMSFLKNKQLDKLIPTLKQPTLGICLGMQLMCSFSEEGETDGLNIFKTQVKAFPKVGKTIHMGWNNFTDFRGNLYHSISKMDDVYFVHGYYAEPCDMTTASCDYLTSFSASLQKDNFYGVQFHPEKSGKVGMQILKNFLKI